MEEPRLRPAGFFHAPATPAPNSAATGDVRLGGHARLGRVGFKQMETLAGWNGPLTATRGEHTGRGLGETFDTASLVHAGMYGNAPKGAYWGRRKGRPLASKNIYDS
jgi:hypothetical protein